MAQYDDLNARQIWAVGIVSAALTAVTILAVQVLYYALLNRHNDVKLAGSEYTASNAYLAAEAEQISRYGRNPETGAVQIPIDRAMTLVVERKSESAEAPQPSEEPAAESEQQPEPPAEKPAEPAEKPAPAVSEENAAESKEEPAEESEAPTVEPEAPAADPSEVPAGEPSEAPAGEPSEEPAVEPSEEPTAEPSEESGEPTAGDDES